MKIPGGCLCGLIRYECSGEPVFQVNCHCSDCQRSSGGPFAPLMFFPEKNVTIIGDVKYFQSKGGSGKYISRGFCPRCGSQLFEQAEARPALLAVRSGTLDNTANFSPTADIYVSQAATWDHMNLDLKKFATQP